MKKLMWLALAVCMAGLLLSCTETEPEQQTELVQAEPNQVISIAWAQSDSTQIQVMEDYVIPVLSETFPEIEFVYTGIATDKAEALKTMSAIGTLPDIYCSDSTIYDTLQNAGNFLDLAPYLEADGWLDENYRDPSLLYYDGELNLITCGQNDYYTPVVYYNKALFKQYGLQEPETMEDLLEICRTLKAVQVYPFTLCATTFEYFLMDSILSSYDPELLNALNAHTTDWENPAVLEALAVFDRLKQMQAFTADAAVKSESDCLAEFSLGTAAMWPAMSWFNTHVAQLDFEVGQFLWPSGNADYPTGYQQLTWSSQYGGWAINPAAEDIETCVAVLKVLLQAEAQRHADCGLRQNFIIENAASVNSPLEQERTAAYESASEYRTLLFLGAMDAETAQDYQTYISLLLSDDPGYLSANFVADFNTTWQDNTKSSP